MTDVRQAGLADADVIAGLAAELAQSFAFCRSDFDLSYPALLADRNACVLVAEQDGDCVGYLLGFWHLTFFANGPVGWVEEVLVRRERRGRGIGRELMTAFERWAAARGCAMVALATRRAAPFYLALGYEESAAYLRRVLSQEAAR
ncbi:MAG TPA: GNAT family N-acetyltransferase [Streptosporangiaceae bacterium]|nr:GNAT family N-acetyltransferase [Streptosporangiaceae bacterium]